MKELQKWHQQFRKSFSAFLRVFLIVLITSILTFIYLSISSPALAVTQEEREAKEAAKDWNAAEDCWHEYFGEKKRTLNSDIESKNVQINLTNQQILL